MQDGRVLVVGGTIRSGPGISGTEKVEIFDSQTNSWNEAAPLEFDRSSHTAQLLNDGRVLVAGGGGGGVENNTHPGADAVIYNPQTNTWTPTEPMVSPRIFSNSVRLPDGRILVTGGMAVKDEPKQIMSASSEIYDPSSNLWKAAANLFQARFGFNLVVIPNGQVLAVGGARDLDCCMSQNSFIGAIESFIPSTDQWQVVGQMPEPAEYTTISLLPGDRFWITGGRADPVHSPYVSDTWLINFQ
jgi:N-acetylneuraminic acid mutarotase